MAGSFHSPNYPKNYDQHDICEWLIDIEENHIISLDFEDVDIAGNCKQDFINVRNWLKMNGRVNMGL